MLNLDITMINTRIFFILLILVLPGIAMADAEDVFINITTDPEPVMLVLHGKPKSIMRQTPARLELSPSNFFQLQLIRKGYERSGGHIGFKLVGADSVHAFIFDTNRLETVSRSIIFPGWGQRYASYSKKGFWFGAFSLGSGAYTGYAHYRYKSADDDLAAAKERWERAILDKEKKRLWGEWSNQYLETDRLYEQRKVWLGLTGYFYAINLIDALALTPMFSGEIRSPDTVYFQLTKKTPLKAIVRTTLVPGWGHYYVGERNKGWIYGFLCATGTFFAVDYYLDYKDQVNRYDLSQNYYRLLQTQGQSISELEIAYQTVLDEEREADKTFRKCQWAAGITAGVWALNVIDMLFSYRSEEILSGQFFTESNNTGGFRLLTDVNHDMATLTLQWQF